jgi:signal transduction histidine kinase
MSEQVRQRALDPFFTTKKRGTSSGTGLGLAMVKGTLEQLEGAVKIDSAPGQGTTVQLYLPLKAPSPATSREGS